MTDVAAAGATADILTLVGFGLFLLGVVFLGLAG
jgi:hypothetical protein